MGNNVKKKRLTARRAATFLAVLGALVMSSGVALMATATSANAAPDDKVVVCKYVSTPGGELDHIVIVSANTLPDGFNGTFPFEWQDAQGGQGGSIAVRLANEGEQAKDVPVSDCPSGEEEPLVATASVTPIQATCDTAADYTATGDNVSFSESAAPAAGTSITVTATADPGAEFAGGATTQDFPLTFDAAPTDCGGTVVSPPKPPTKHHTTTKTPTVTPTVVHAGLTGATVEDMRGEQGLALMFAGMLMLIAAGGLGMRLRGGESQI